MSTPRETIAVDLEIEPKTRLEDKPFVLDYGDTGPRSRSDVENRGTIGHNK